MYSKITKGRVLVAASTYKGGDADYYCDGHADERFINAAIQYLSENFDGGIVTLSEGEFDLRAYILNSYSNIVIQGVGPQTVLNCNAAASGIRVLGDSATYTNRNVTRNLKLVKTATGNYALISYQYTSYGTIENCYLDNSYYFGILIDDCEHAIISHNFLTRQGVSSILVLDSEFVMVDGNDISGGNTWGQSSGIVIDSATTYSTYITICNNIIHDFTSDAAHLNAIRNASSYAVISNNQIHTIENTDGEVHAINSHMIPTDCIITGNVISDIVADTAGQEAIGIKLYSDDRTTVANNKITNVSNIATAEDGAGIYLNTLSASYDHLLSANAIYNCSGYGIYIDSGVYRTIVVGNKAVDNGNLISRWGCDSSTTSPALLAEASCTIVGAGTWGFTSTNPYDGVGQWRYTAGDIAATGGRVHFIQDPGPGIMGGVTANAHYRFSAYLNTYSSASGLVGLQLYQVTTGGGETTVTVWTSATSGWQLLTTSATIYASATMFALYMQASTSVATGSFVDVDLVRFHETGIGNIYERNFYDGGTDTASINSWS